MDQIQNFELLVKNSNLPEDLKDKCFKLISRLSKMAGSGAYSQEFDNVEKYIQTILSIPFGKYVQESLDSTKVMEELNSNHYGLMVVKDKIVEYISVMQLQARADRNISNDSDTQMSMNTLSGNSSRAPVLCFIGVQGIGKTTFAKSLSSALNRPFVRISMNAMSGVAQIKGAPRTVVGSEPGQIVKALIRAGCMNPMILLDEIDKVSGSEDKRFDFLAAAMEVLDPEQNATFVDQYLDYPIDLSKVFFICTANTLGTLSAALLDRLEIIRFSSYTDAEKEHIARDYLLPKIRKSTGLNESQMSFSEDVWPLMIRPLGFDAGIRQLERNIVNVARKVARIIVEKNIPSVNINPQNFRQFIPDGIGIYS